MDITRRKFLHTSLVSGALTQLPFLVQASTTKTLVKPLPLPKIIRPSEPAYTDLRRGMNGRYIGSPLNIFLPSNIEDIIQSLDIALQTSSGVAVRSGGHSYENNVLHPEIKNLLDLSLANSVSYDNEHDVIAIEAGATLAKVYTELYYRWGITIPAGTCPSVGIGGHIPSGGYGALSRLHGLVVDTLYGIDILTIDKNGRIHRNIASRDSTDPALRDLWWAHTGGGPGQFGIVLRYLFKNNTAYSLPSPPTDLLLSTVTWSWDSLGQREFEYIINTFIAFFAAHSVSQTERSLFSQLRPQHFSAGTFEMCTQIPANNPEAQKLLDQFEKEMTAQSPAARTLRMSIPWLHAVKNTVHFSIPDTTRRFKGKSANIKNPLSQTSINELYLALTDKSYDNPSSVVMFTSFGGKINEQSIDSTACAHRKSSVRVNYIVFWNTEEEDKKNLSWIRRLYKNMWKETGGVPVYNEYTEGCYIGYKDDDIADPEFNSSNLTYRDLYWNTNQSRLKKIKSYWDPQAIFTINNGV